jgi:translation initiation factor 3 subunit E
MNHKAWIIHQILIYSFVNQGQKQSNLGLFGSLFTDRSQAQGYLNIIQLKCQYLLRYLISSLILSGSFESLKDLILPVVIQEKSKYSDLYTQFIEALYDRFDFNEALTIAKSLGKAA